MAVLTDKHVEQFWKFVMEWCVRFRVMDWRIIKAEEATADDGCLSACTPDFEHRSAKITIYRDWGDELPLNAQSLSEVAMHEVLHVVMAGFCEVAEDRYATLKQINTAEHDVIRAIISMYYKKGMVEN